MDPHDLKAQYPVSNVFKLNHQIPPPFVCVRSSTTGSERRIYGIINQAHPDVEECITELAIV